MGHGCLAPGYRAMSTTAVRSRMVHRATVQRDSAGGRDKWGQEQAAQWVTRHASLPCFAWVRLSRAQSERITADYTAVIEDLRMIVPLGTSINETDRVTVIKNRAGDELFPGPMGIDSVTYHHTHLEVALVQVGG